MRQIVGSVGVLLLLALGWWFQPEVALTVRPAPALVASTPCGATPEVLVRARAGATQLAVPLPRVPAGFAVQWRVALPFSPAQGLTGVALGDAVVFDRYGTVERTGAGPVTLVQGLPDNLTLTALGGKFGHEGVAAVSTVPPGCVAD